MDIGWSLRWWRRLAVVSALCLTPSSGSGVEQDNIYRTLVQRVEGGDFHALRLARMKSSDCEPRGTKADLGAMNDLGGHPKPAIEGHFKTGQR
jgi:hypothetical protein